MANIDIETIDLDMEDSSEDTILDNEKIAEAKKEQGNQLYKLKSYTTALPLYCEAIELCPNNPSYYGNRSACYMMLKNYSLALDDAKKSVDIDPKFVKGWIRIAKCQLAMGDISGAEKSLGQVKTIDPKNPSYLEELKSLQTLSRFDEEATKALNKEDFRKVVFCLDRALEIAVSCVKYKLLKGECLARLGRYQEALELSSDILAKDKKNVDAILVRGMCLYYQDQVDTAFQHFQHVLRLAPDHPKASAIFKKAKVLRVKKEEGNQLFKAGKFAEAYDVYTEALEIDPYNTKTNAKLYFNRALINNTRGKLEEAVADCTKALSLDPDYQKALLKRAKCYMDMKKFEEAVRDYEEALRKDKSKEIRQLLHDAKLELKKSQRKDYYKILGVDKSASTEDIKRAYRKRALVHHPDRHANATDDEKKVQEKMFKEVGEAYTILSDPNKRRRYDSGQDIEDLQGCGADFDPQGMFQAFFADSGPQFFQAQGFPGTSFHFSFN